MNRTGLNNHYINRIVKLSVIACSNDGPYNIMEFFDLSKEQADFILDNIPTTLSGLAKGAISDNEQK